MQHSLALLKTSNRSYKKQKFYFSFKGMQTGYHTISKCATSITQNSHVFCVIIRVEDSVKLKSNEIFH